MAAAWHVQVLAQEQSRGDNMETASPMVRLARDSQHRWLPLPLRLSSPRGTAVADRPRGSIVVGLTFQHNYGT